MISAVQVKSLRCHTWRGIESCSTGNLNCTVFGNFQKGKLSLSTSKFTDAGFVPGTSPRERSSQAFLSYIAVFGGKFIQSFELRVPRSNTFPYTRWVSPHGSIKTVNIAIIRMVVCLRRLFQPSTILIHDSDSQLFIYCVRGQMHVRFHIHLGHQ